MATKKTQTKSGSKPPAKEVNVDALLGAASLFEPARLAAWDAVGLTLTQLRVLYELSKNDGMGNAALADRLAVTRPSVSALLERLDRGGYIRREISPKDRRGIQILLEPAAREALTAAKDELKKQVTALLGELDEGEAKQLVEALATVANGISAG